MTKICRLVLLPVLLLTAGSAFAELKIAVVNVQRAIGECNEAKGLIAKLEADTAPDQSAIKALGAEITQLQDKFKLAGGVDIPGAPRGTGMVRHDIGDFHGYQMVVEWPEAQAFRKSLTTSDGKPLGDKDFHVSLHGGIGDAVKKAKATPTGDE